MHKNCFINYKHIAVLFIIIQTALFSVVPRNGFNKKDQSNFNLYSYSLDSDNTPEKDILTKQKDMKESEISRNIDSYDNQIENIKKNSLL